jgi:hypothetical protein
MAPLWAADEAESFCTAAQYQTVTSSSFLAISMAPNWLRDSGSALCGPLNFLGRHGLVSWSHPKSSRSAVEGRAGR